MNIEEVVGLANKYIAEGSSVRSLLDLQIKTEDRFVKATRLDFGKILNLIQDGFI